MTASLPALQGFHSAAKLLRIAPVGGKTYAEIVADEIRTAGYSVGIVGYIDGKGRDMWAADARREGDENRYVARADSELRAWVALKQSIWEGDKL